MSILQTEPRAQEVWFDEYSLWINFVDGRQLSVPLAYFPRLQHATSEQRNNFEISGGGIGLHWDDLDEDISVPNLLMGHYDKQAV